MLPVISSSIASVVMGQRWFEEAQPWRSTQIMLANSSLTAVRYQDEILLHLMLEQDSAECKVCSQFFDDKGLDANDEWDILYQSYPSTTTGAH